MVTKRNTGSRAEGFRVRYNTYLTEFGTKITLFNITEVKDGMNRVTSTSETSKLIKCDIQYVNKNDLSHINLGDVQIGDGMLFVKHSESINLHDEVEFDKVRWRIMSQIEGELVTGELVYKGYIIRKNE